jgi:hypothetical protein
VSRVVWCLECERVGRCAIDEDGDERCSYDDCNAAPYDLWPWGGPFERGRYYLHYSDENMQGLEAGRREEEEREDQEDAA